MIAIGLSGTKSVFKVGVLTPKIEDFHFSRLKIRPDREAENWSKNWTPSLKIEGNQILAALPGAKPFPGLSPRQGRQN